MKKAKGSTGEVNKQDLSEKQEATEEEWTFVDSILPITPEQLAAMESAVKYTANQVADAFDDEDG